MAALYHALGTPRILQGLNRLCGLVEPRRGIGCGEWQRLAEAAKTKRDPDRSRGLPVSAGHLAPTHDPQGTQEGGCVRIGRADIQHFFEIT
jgi:hypothetical protein